MRLKMFKENFKSSGGNWLGAVRNWIKWHCINGDSVTWSSNDELRPRITVKNIEDAAGEAAWATLEPFLNIEKGVREIVNIQLEEGKNIHDILSEVYKYLRKVSSYFGVSEIIIDLPKDVCRLAEEARLEIVDRNGDDVFKQSIWNSVTQKLWKISNKLKWKIH